MSILTATNIIHEKQNWIQSDPIKKQETDKKIKDKWLQLGLPVSVLEIDPDCVRFLVTSGMIYPIIGLANLSDHPEKEAIRIKDQQCMVKIKGVWQNWEEISQLIKKDPKDKTCLISCNQPLEVWSYISPSGFVPRNRLHYKQIYPIALLSKTQYDKVKDIAKHFFLKNLEVDTEIKKTGVLQLMTTYQKDVNTPFYLEHCTIRVIREVNGQYELYSFGSEMAEDQYKKVMPHQSWINPSILTTVETKIGMCDFQEFRPKDLCRVTSIPLTSERANRILHMINQISQKDLRFNYIQQNCFSLAHEAMKLSGYEMPDIRMSFGQLLSWRLQTQENYPLICKMSRLAVQLSKGIEQRTPLCIKQAVVPAKYILNKAATLFTNCLVMGLGGYKTSMTLPSEAMEEKLSQNIGMISFSRLIRSPGDLLKEETSVIHHSLPFIEWQLKQPSTFVVQPERNKPKLILFPEGKELGH